MINLIKFIHVIFALSLLGITMFCFAFISKNKTPVSPYIHQLILYISIIALITGTLLVYPKHFTFHTPWIQAAYILVICYASLIALFNRYRHLFLFKNKTVLLLTYFMLILLLVGVIHDAVTKTTFLI
jgi:hypothetical protein